MPDIDDVKKYVKRALKKGTLKVQIGIISLNKKILCNYKHHNYCSCGSSPNNTWSQKVR